MDFLVPSILNTFLGPAVTACPTLRGDLALRPTPYTLNPILGEAVLSVLIAKASELGLGVSGIGFRGIGV